MKKFFLGLFSVIGLAIFCLMVFGYFYEPTPKDRARLAIEICRENVERDVKYGRGSYGFLMPACDNMAEEFQRKYGHKP